MCLGMNPGDERRLEESEFVIASSNRDKGQDEICSDGVKAQRVASRL